MRFNGGGVVNGLEPPPPGLLGPNASSQLSGYQINTFLILEAIPVYDGNYRLTSQD